MRAWMIGTMLLVGACTAAGSTDKNEPGDPDSDNAPNETDSGGEDSTVPDTDVVDTDPDETDPPDTDPPDTDPPDTDPPAEACLLISEVIEGSSLNKALEIVNCGTDALDLSPYEICVVINEAITCTSTFALSGTLTKGGVATLCHGGLSSSVYSGACTFETSAVLSFSGDDRLAIRTSADGAVVDAFGVLATQPGPVWEAKTLRRCSTTAFDGTGTFVLDDHYTTHAEDDFTDFGVAPTFPGCP